MTEQTHASAQKSQTAGSQRSDSARQQTQSIEGALPQGTLARGFVDPNSLSPGNVQYLQRAMGNRAVGQLLREEHTVQRAANLDSASLNSASESADTSAAGAEGGVVSDKLAAEIRHASGGGAPVPDAMRTTMENRMGMSYGDVRIHTGAKADRLSRKLNAEAFTVGKNAFFRKGAYNPTTQSGRHLLSHELTHVAQQSGGNRLSRQPMTALNIQRKMSFKATDMGDTKSTNQQMRNLVKKTGISVEDSSYEKIKSLVREYEAEISASAELAQLNAILGLIQVWVSHHEKRTELDNRRVPILSALQKAARAEKPKALIQVKYMNDLEATTPQGEAKPGARKFQFLSETGRAYPTQSAKGLAKHETGNVGQTQITLDLVKKYQLTDAELAAIKVYAVEDYKYINPAQAGIDPWLKSQMPAVTKIDGERGGSAKVLTNQNNSIRMMIESGTLKKGFNALVMGSRDGSKDEPLGRGEITSITREKAKEQGEGQNEGQDEIFRRGDLVVIQLTGFAGTQKDDIVQFADTGVESMAQATFEGRRHGHMAISGLKKLPDHAGDVFRGFTMLPEVMKDTYQIGKEVPYHNFTSTAKSKFPSLKFIEEELVKDKANGSKKVGVLLKLNVQEKGKDISEISQAKHEEEVLMLPGTKFKVESNPTLTAGEGGYAGLSYYEVRAVQVPSTDQPAPTQTNTQPGSNQQNAQPAPKRPNASLPSKPTNPTKAPQGKKKKGLFW